MAYRSQISIAAWYREALGLTHEAAVGVPEGASFMVAPTGERLELLAVDVEPSAWNEPIAARRRSAVEREFGRLKHEYGFAFLRVRRTERVRLHADLAILARLASALSVARKRVEAA